nr:glycoside hydrolase family 3 N-terminal domain-containing protein [Arthrobacter sp. H5]
MSPEELAGQVMVGFYAGADPAVQEQTISDLHLAGSIIMGDNVPAAADGTVDTEAIKAVNQRLKDAVAADGRDWPAVISVDQEGGVVARLRAPLTEWPTPMAYGAAVDPELARLGMSALASELAGLGFTMDHAPSADVTLGSSDPTIGARSFSGDPAAVGPLAIAAAEGVVQAGLLPSVKHFPGHGSVPTDSHLGLPVQTASVEELQARDWVPFQEAVDAGTPVIMMGHIAVEALDPGVPSSVSPANYEALRGLGFEGVVVTDALNMAAVEEQFPGGQAAPQALAAGADLLLMPADSYAAHAAILEALESGELPEERLVEAATRVVAMMKWQGEWSAEPAQPGTGIEQSLAASAAAVTILTGQCSGDLLGGTASLSGGSAIDQERFAAAAQSRGVTVGPEGTTVSLAGFGGAGSSAEVAVSLDAPWLLDSLDAPVKVALYGNSEGSFDALLAVLTGAAEAPGKLPVDTAEFTAGTGC